MSKTKRDLNNIYRYCPRVDNTADWLIRVWFVPYQVRHKRTKDIVNMATFVDVSRNGVTMKTTHPMLLALAKDYLNNKDEVWMPLHDLLSELLPELD